MRSHYHQSRSSSDPLPHRRWLQWFYDWPIGRKQISALILSELISLGLVGLGATLLVFGLRAQLANQSQAELAVAEIAYNIKIDQMIFGFQGQAENAEVIRAAEQGQGSGEVNSILINEIWRQKIEIALLVDREARVIDSAGIYPEGEIFNPNGLVVKALNTAEQITATEVITQATLARDTARSAELLSQNTLPLADGQHRFLIRYTVTPVRKPNSELVGALIAGDVVKQAIVSQANASFNGGYSAIYLRTASGEFSLATAQEQSPAGIQEQLSLPHQDLLVQAAEARGGTVTDWISVGPRSYVMSAKAIPNHRGQPTAILVRGTAVTGVSQLLLETLAFQILVAVLAIVIDIALARFLARAVAAPIQALRQTTQQFSQGNRQVRAEIYAQDEVGALALAFNEMATQINSTLDQLAQVNQELIQSEKMAVLGQLVASIAHELNTPLGAIRSSTGSMTRFLEQEWPQLPEFLSGLQPEQRQAFLQLIQPQTPDRTSLSSREKRQLRRSLQQQLTAQGVPESESLAATLVAMGVWGDIEGFLPLFKDPQGAQILEMAYQVSTLHTNLRTIDMASERAATVVFALRTYSRHDPSRAPAPLLVIEGMETALTLYHNQLQHGIDLIRDYPPDSPQILGYADELTQVWMNLIQNALQAMDHKGRLQIQIRVQPEQIEVNITDSGPGIPAELKGKIFTPFFTTKPIGEGTGLGLDIVRRIVERHQGKLTVKSVPGKTTFTVSLPLSPTGDPHA